MFEYKVDNANGRRAWAFFAVGVGCFVFTVFAAVGVWLVSSNAYYSLILALAAHLQLLVGMSAFAFVLGRRMQIRGGKDGFELSDRAHEAEGAQKATDAAQVVTDQLQGEA
jgi:hypothetical protein